MTLECLGLSRYRYRTKVSTVSKSFFRHTSDTFLCRQQSLVDQIDCYDGRDVWVDSGKLDTAVGGVFSLLLQVPSTGSSPLMVGFATVHR